MKKTLLFLLCLGTLTNAWSQVKLPQVRVYESRGWSIQHSVMSWDSLSVYFSAKAPNAASFDLFVLRAEGMRWGEPQRIDALCTDEDELWPSVSSDESMLFYLHRTPANPADKNSFEKTRIWRARFTEGQWTEAAPIIISSDEDSEPRILEDNKTLLFLRREESKKHDGKWLPFAATMMDDHNWTLPAPYTVQPVSAPIIALCGTTVMKKGGRPLTSSKVLVYDAISEQLKQQARVHPVSGSWRVALQANQQYRVAVTADGYSYHYIDRKNGSLQDREEQNVGQIELDNQLELRLNTYDIETQNILSSIQQTLPLGKLHTIPLSYPGYDDTTLVVNTLRPTVFTETELDIPLMPKKRMHHFIVIDAKTRRAVPDVTMLLNGKPIVPDTALRIRQDLALQVTAPGYLFYDTLLFTGNDKQERQVMIRMQPLEKDLVLQLRNIQFEYDSYELTESSNEALEALAQLLFTNPTLHIELSSHTDDQGSDRYNDRLSSLRGEAVATWLKRRGVDPARIESKGYGKHKPLVPNDSDEHRALNRRVEIKVTEF